MWLETDAGSGLPLTLFDVTHPGLAAVKNWYVLTTDLIPKHQRDRD